MKLNDYFSQQKTQQFSDIDKLELYQKFLYKKNQWSPIKRFRFVHAKSFVYSVFATILIIGTYGVYFFNTSIDSPWFTISSNRNTAQADYIAKVVEFNGNFSIEHQGEILQTQNIGNGDSILLKSWSEMSFEINSGTKSKIIGPAKLTLQQITDSKETKYRINLIYGDFIQMEGNQTPQNVELAVNDMLIKQADKNKPVNFQFINNWNNHIIKNNGSALLVTKNGNSKDTQINNKQVLAMQDNDITLFKDRDTFTREMKKGNVSQTFALATNSVKTTVKNSSGDDNTPISFMQLLNDEEGNTPSDTTSNTETISKDIASMIGASKQVLNPAQNTKLWGTLYGGFLLEDISSTYIARVEGDTAAYNTNFQKIEERIQQLYTSFDLKYPGKLSTAIPSLITTLLADYEVPPKYIHNLQALQWRLAIISKAWIASVPKGEGTKAREQVLQNRTTNLIFQ